MCAVCLPIICLHLFLFPKNKHVERKSCLAFQYYNVKLLYVPYTNFFDKLFFLSKDKLRIECVVLSKIKKEPTKLLYINVNNFLKLI